MGVQPGGCNVRVVDSSTRARLRLLCAIPLAALCIAGLRASAQPAARTPEGQPDLQGMWLNDTATPLERPAEFAGKASLTDQEARDYEKRYQLERTTALSRGDPAFELALAGDLDTYEPGRLLSGNRTSLITDPADGRVPALTPAAQQRAADRAAQLKVHSAENPEDFPNAERCLVVGNSAGPPMLPVFYNNDVQIVQTRGYVTIQVEMIHEARVIPLDGRAHLPSSIRKWTGDSVGRWEGDTLIVDTTNFSPNTTFRGSGPGLHVVERFSLVTPDTLRYQFTVDDPASFVRPWTAESVLTRTNGRMFEYACHEANYSLTNMLRGARLAEHEGR